MVHPVDERMRVAVHGLRELLVRAGRLAERLDDLDAVDVLDRSRAHVLACAHGFLVPEVVVLHHAHVGGEPDGQRDERDERHAPIEREHERDDGQRNQQIRRHLRQQVRERRLDAVHLLHHDVLELARRRVQHVAERHARELFGDEPADPRDRRERRDVREGRRGVVEHEVGPVACGGRRAPAQVESEVAHVPQHADDHLAGGVVGHDGARHAHDGQKHRQRETRPVRAARPLQQARDGVRPLAPLRPSRRSGTGLGGGGSARGRAVRSRAACGRVACGCLVR